MLMTCALYSLMNGLAYWGLSARKKQSAKGKNKMHEMAYNFY